MAIPDYQSLMLPVLKNSVSGEKRVADIYNLIADEFHLSEMEREALLPSGRQRILHNRIHWAKFYLSKAGYIASPSRGRFIATEAGKTLLLKNPSRIDLNTLLKVPSFKDFYKNEKQQSNSTNNLILNDVYSEEITPEEQIYALYHSHSISLKEELLERIIQNSPVFFEQLIVDLLVAMGYGGSHKDAAERLGRSGDGGVDGVINEDRLGLDRIYLQAKRYAPGNQVGSPEVNGFVGSLVGLGARKGVFVTTSSFSQPAKDFVSKLTHRVVLIEGKELANLMLEHNIGVRSQRTIEFKRLDEDFFTEE